MSSAGRVRRDVALKIVRPGMDTREVIARFEAERQTLAMMDHPNIATVLDAGATDSGRPYFVMELVDGVPLTEYCNQQRVSTRQRLELFTGVCQSVQHAHQKGIIHRDLKPSNILVTLQDGVPVPKIIDFGIAKAINQQLTADVTFTHLGQLVCTPLYDSPEQLETGGLGVDTRSDIYSLGVVLYELLTGSTPFDKARLEAVGLDEYRRVLREEEPVRPRAGKQRSTSHSRRQKAGGGTGMRGDCARGAHAQRVTHTPEKNRRALVQRGYMPDSDRARDPARPYRTSIFIRGSKR